MFFQVLDFGASRDGIPETKLGKRVVVNRRGREIAPTSIDSDSESD